MGGGERVWAHLFCERAVPTPNETGVGFRKGACLFLNAGGGCRTGGDLLRKGGVLKGGGLSIWRRRWLIERAPVGFEKAPVVERARVGFERARVGFEQVGVVERAPVVS